MARNDFEEVSENQSDEAASRAAGRFNMAQAKKRREVNSIADLFEPFADLTPEKLDAAIKGYGQNEEKRQQDVFNIIRKAHGANPVNYSTQTRTSAGDIPAADNPSGRGGALAPITGRKVDPNSIDVDNNAIGVGAVTRRGSMQGGSTSAALFTRFTMDEATSHKRGVDRRLTIAALAPYRSAFAKHEKLHENGATCASPGCNSTRRDLEGNIDASTGLPKPAPYALKHFLAHHAGPGSLLEAQSAASRAAEAAKPENAPYVPMTEEEYRSNPHTQAVEQKYMVAHAAGVNPEHVTAFISAGKAGTKAAGSAKGMPSSLPQVRRSMKNFEPPAPFLWEVQDETHRNIVRGMWELQHKVHQADQGTRVERVKNATYKRKPAGYKEKKLAEIGAEDTKARTAWGVVKSALQSFASKPDAKVASDTLNSAVMREVQGSGEGRARAQTGLGQLGQAPGVNRPTPYANVTPTAAPLNRGRNAARAESARVAGNVASELAQNGNDTAEASGTVTGAERLVSEADGAAAATPTETTRGGRRRSVLNQNKRAQREISGE